jgi:hypothetical protein
MARKTIYYDFDTPADFLVHCTQRPEWKQKHKYECMAILEVVNELRTLKRKKQWWKR